MDTQSDTKFADTKFDTQFEESLKKATTWEELEQTSGLTKSILIKRIEQLQLDANHLPAIDESSCTKLPRKMILKYCSKGTGISQVDIIEALPPFKQKS